MSERHNFEETEEDKEPTNLLILCSFEKEDIPGSDLFMNFQSYAISHNNGVHIIVNEIEKPGFQEYTLWESFPSVQHIPVGEESVLTFHISDNGCLMAGGIWQIGGTGERNWLNCLCSEMVDLVEVEELLSKEELRLVHQAVKKAEYYLIEEWQYKGIFPYVCREKGDNAPEKTHQKPENVMDVWLQDHTWHMYWHVIQPIRQTCLLQVTYDPQRAGDPFFVEVLETRADEDV